MLRIQGATRKRVVSPYLRARSESGEDRLIDACYNGGTEWACAYRAGAK